MQITKEAVADIKVAIKEFENKHGIKIEGQCAFHPDETRMTLTLRSINGDGRVFDPRESAFHRLAPKLGLSPTDLRVTFTNGNDSFILVGLEPTRGTTPLVCERVRDRKVFMFSVSEVKKALGHPVDNTIRKVTRTPLKPLPPDEDPGEPKAKKIICLVTENPYKVGSKAAITFDLMKEVVTVEAFKAAIAANPGKYDGSYLSWAAQPHGKQPAYIRVVEE